MSLCCLLACMVYDKKISSSYLLLDNVFFKLWLLSRFFFVFGFYNLNIICLDVIFLGGRRGSHPAWCSLISLDLWLDVTNTGKPKSSFPQVFLLSPYLFLLQLYNMYIIWYYSTVLGFFTLFSFFSSLFFILGCTYWPVFKFTDSNKCITLWFHFAFT